jgi:hypothetical protein
MVACSCKDWNKGMPSLCAAVEIARRHGLGYEGRRMKYCPWCRRKLKKVKPIGESHERKGKEKAG